VAKIKGKFVWHKHMETDEVLMIIHGEMKILFRDNSFINLKAGEMYIVPKGKEHKPIANDECHSLMIELCGTINTGDAGGKKTIIESAWI
jgi:mannose-6-phosphate isomerase-like protein (cupin superfamily)